MKFEDIKVWQMSEELTLGMYELFKESKDRGFKDQICRASISIMNNISEGFERGTLKDKQRFFTIAKGSCGEVRSMLHIALQLDYISQSQYDEYHNMCCGISAGLYNLGKNMKF